IAYVARGRSEHESVKRRAGVVQRSEHQIEMTRAVLGTLGCNGDDDRALRLALLEAAAHLDHPLEQIAGAHWLGENPADALLQLRAVRGVIGDDRRPLTHGDDRQLVFPAT